MSFYLVYYLVILINFQAYLLYFYILFGNYCFTSRNIYYNIIL
uniref:Uncharacterized protein n=1 Tax=Vertebrata thuyoides TaxID=2006970 RepID=A0A1Z1MAN9_9FLOR|nr:hypothetical protein [Vertebrata thuyoides]ARW63148.1 hypothetical protein [Vertebrata thuyoides]